MSDGQAAISAELVGQLKEVVGARNVLYEPVDLACYECDGETLDIARPDVVVLPGSTAEVQAVVRLAARASVPFTPRGAGTGLSGGATCIGGGISLVLTRMTKILSVDTADLSALAEVGVTNASLSKAAEPYGLYFAPDPSSQAAATLGGNLAENSGGPHTLKYGTTVNHVLGVRVVMPDGSLTTFGGKARDCFGLDLLGLFVGSEGTLGLATEVYVKLTARPERVETMLAYFESVEAGGTAVSAIVATGVVPAAMEMIDNLTLRAVEDALKLGLNREAGALLIVELDGSSASVALERETVRQVVGSHGGEGIVWAGSAAERARIWKARKSAFGSLGRLAPHAYVLDGVIPRSKLAQAIARIAQIGQKHEVTIANVYHAGDGNLHPAILYNRENTQEVNRVVKAGREILELCVRLGGTLSGEHGIGIEKVVEMPFLFSAAELTAMNWLKEVFDPARLANPAKVLPAPKACGESGARPLARHTLSQSSLPD
jgi:glycolate oxidase